MAPRYVVSSELSQTGDISYAPRWVVGVVSFLNQNTFDLSTGLSVNQSEDYAMKERPEPLVMSSAVVAVNTSSSKTAHVTNLNAVLMGDTNFLSSIMPGDWVACCMVYSDNEATRIARAMQKGTPINKWEDGLKFLGRVQGMRKSVQVAPDGQHMTRYSLSCVGFAEFDYSLFYHNALQQVQRLAASMNAFGISIQKLMSNKGPEAGVFDINKVLPEFIRAVFGTGAWSKTAGIGNLQGGSGSPNRPLLIPKTVGKWLGVAAEKYSDILRPIVGVQHYRTGASAEPTQRTADAWKTFRPDNVTAEDGYFSLPSKLTGSYAPAAPPGQTTVWGLLSSFSNPPVNELFVTLRSDHIDGRIMPHFIARQNPYTTDGATLAEVLKRDAEEQVTQATKKPGKPPPKPPQKPSKPKGPQDFTSFQELPRWVIDASMLYSMDIGRSEALRFNYVFISGVGAGSGTSIEGSFVRAPPNMDELDIKRNGLRPFMASTNCFFDDARLGPTAWRDIMTDVMVNQNLTLSGTFNLVGIRAPIAVGDNMEFENVVYHIESVNHNCSITPTGQRLWMTTLSVSHGILLDTARGTEMDDRGGLYAGAHGEQFFAAYLPLTEEKDV